MGSRVCDMTGQSKVSEIVQGGREARRIGHQSLGGDLGIASDRQPLREWKVDGREYLEKLIAGAKFGVARGVCDKGESRGDEKSEER